MKYSLHLASMLVCLAACQSSPTTPAATPALPKQEHALKEPAAPTQDKPEYIESGMLTVNGQLVGEITTSQLERQLGRPDSIAKGAAECGNMLAVLNKIDSPAGDFWYYGHTVYEVSGTHAILVIFDVTTSKFQGKLGSLILNKNTTLEDVRRSFPKSAKQAEVPSTGRPGEEMSLPFYYKGEQTDESLNLLFKKGRLQEVEFYMPC